MATKYNIEEIIKAVPLFSDLKEEQRNFLIPLCDVINLEPKKLLFSQGEKLDFLYILISGELSTILSNKNNENPYIGAISPGETVGELSILSQKMTTASVYAADDSLLLRITDRKSVV